MRKKKTKLPKIKLPKINVFATVPVLGSQINKVRRIVRSGKLPGKNKGKSTKSSIAGNLPKISLPTLPYRGWIILLVVLFLVAGIVGFIVFKISKWSPVGTAFISSETPLIVNTNNVSVLLAVYDTNNGYSFIDYLTLVSLDTKTGKNKAVVISPYFVTSVLGSRNLKLKNILNYSLSEGAPAIDMLSTAVEDLLGLKVDRYIMVDSKSLVTMLDTLSVKYKVDTTFTDPDAGSFESGEIIGGEKLFKYIASDSIGLNKRAERQADFVKSVFQDYANWITYIRWFTASDQIVSSISTNLSTTELVNLLIGITSGNLGVVTLDTSEGTVDSSKQDFYITPLRSAINKKIATEFARLEVRREQARIEIYNATQIGGLASRNQRLLENIGAIVIRTGNAPKQEVETKLYVAERDKYPETILAIREILRNKLIVIDEEYPSNHTGEIILVLGENAITEADLY